VAGVARERRLERRLDDLAVDLLLERARHLREGVPATLELRRADRALAGAARALLAPRLRAAARDHAAALRLRGAGAARVRLRANRLVDEMRLHLGAEDRIVELVRLVLRAEHGSGRHQRSPPEQIARWGGEKQVRLGRRERAWPCATCATEDDA